MGSYLQSCGINMGDDLVGAAKGNKFGHFEDIRFVELHKKSLLRNKSHMYSPAHNLIFSQNEITEAKKIVSDRNEKYQHWGWKDPRSSLYLKDWYAIEPGIKFIFLYRHPMSVIDSLVRRATDRRLKVLPWQAATAWIRYNEEILSFYKSHIDNCILININNFNETHNESTVILENWLGLKLPEPYTDVYHPGEISTGSTNNKILYKLISKIYYKKLSHIFSELEAFSKI